MASNLQELFQQLAMVAPELCQPKDDGFLLSGYYFSFLSSSDELCAYSQGIEFGQPAHDWLQGALQRAIYDKGWVLETCQLTTHNGYNAIIGNEYNSDWQPTMAEALLSALIATLESEEK